jgi:hypothetical protein
MPTNRQVARRHRSPLSLAIRGYLARRRRRMSLVRVVTEYVDVPVDRLTIVYLPLDVSEQKVADVRREARQEFA